MAIEKEESLIITIREPNERQGGFIWALKQGWTDVFSARHVIVQLFWRDFIAQFRQSLLGYLWAIINPLMGVVSFLILYFVGVLQPGDGGIPYTLYVLIGSMLWGTMIGAMGAVSNGLRSQAALILRTNIPKLALAVSSLANIFYTMLLNMITLGIVFFLYDFTPTLWFLAYPILVFPLLLFGVAVGLVLSVIGTIAKDIPTMVNYGFSILMYVTPIIYVPSKITEGSLIAMAIKYNPFTYFIDLPRSLICLGTTGDWAVFGYCSFAIVLLFIVSLRIFYLIYDLVAERL